MTIEVRQMVIKSEVAQSDRSQTQPDNDADDPEKDKKTTQLSWMDMRRMLERIERTRER